MKIRRKCPMCGKIYYATIVSQVYCSTQCKKKHDNQKHYDQIRKKPRLPRTEDESATYAQKIIEIRVKPYVSVTEAALLLGISRPTMYIMIKKNGLNILRAGRTTLIAQKDIEDLKFKPTTGDFRPAIYAKKELTIPKAMPDLPEEFIEEIIEEPEIDITGCWTTEDAAAAHNICKDQMRSICRKQGFEKIVKDKKIYWRIEEVEAFFKKNYQTEGAEHVTEWYSVKQIREIYGISERVIAWTVKHNEVPKKRMGRIMLYSKTHFDAARGIGVLDPKVFISFQEVMKTYGITLKQATGIALKKRFKKTRLLTHIYTQREDWEKWASESKLKVKT